MSLLEKQSLDAETPMLYMLYTEVHSVGVDTLVETP